MQTATKNPMPNEVKKKISDSMKGRELTRQHRYKIGLALRKRFRALRMQNM